jgi:hypothetical protein
VCKDDDGGWYSSRSVMTGDTDAGGKPAPWRSTSNVAPVAGMPRAYQIIPPMVSEVKPSALVSKFRNYNLADRLTFEDITGNPRSTAADISWETIGNIEHACISFRGYCGSMLAITYREHCASADALADGCIRERWRFAPGLGLVSVEVLSQSTTWEGLCTRDGKSSKQCYRFEDINAYRVELK